MVTSGQRKISDCRDARPCVSMTRCPDFTWDARPCVSTVLFLWCYRFKRWQCFVGTVAKRFIGRGTTTTKSSARPRLIYDGSIRQFYFQRAQYPQWAIGDHFNNSWIFNNFRTWLFFHNVFICDNSVFVGTKLMVFLRNCLFCTTALREHDRTQTKLVDCWNFSLDRGQ